MENSNEEIQDGENQGEHAIFSYPPEEANLAWGAREASYILGFAGVLNNLGLSDEALASIILNKINLEYQKEMLRMHLESDERIAAIYSKSPYFIPKTEESD